MARIPLGNFGEGGGTAPVQHTRIADPYGAKAQALDGLARTVGGIADQHLQRMGQEQDALARAKAARAVLDHDVAVSERTQDIEAKVASGEIDYNEAEKAYDDEVGAIERPTVDGLDEASSYSLDTAFQATNAKWKGRVGEVVQTARRADIKGQVGGAIDALAKIADQGGDVEEVNRKADALIPLVKAAGLDPKVVQDLKDRNWSNEVQQRILGAQGNLATLEALQNDLTNEKGRYFDKLDPEKRALAVRSVQGDIAQIQNRVAVEADKRETIAGNVVTKLEDAVVVGVPLTAERWLADREAVKGTTHEAEFMRVYQQADEILKVRQLPFGQQQAYIEKIEADFKAGPSDDPKREQSRIGTLRRVLDEGRKLAKESPITFLQHQTGQEVPQIDFSGMESGDTSQIVGQLQQRFAQVQALRKQYGNDVGLNPWRPEEGDALKQVLATANDKAKLSVLSLVAGAAPDAKSYAAALTPLATSDRSTMLAGMAQYRGLKSGSGIEIAPTILNGSRILADKSVVRPTEKAMLAAFESYAGEAIPNGSPQRADAYLAFKTMYMGMADQAGYRHSDGAEPPNSKLAEGAFNLATGGVSEIRGRKIVRPWGMNEDSFTDRVDSEIERIAKDSGFSRGNLRDMPLVAAPGLEGTYYLLNGDSVQVDPKTKQPLMVKVK